MLFIEDIVTFIMSYYSSAGNKKITNAIDTIAPLPIRCPSWPIAGSFEIKLTT